MNSISSLNCSRCNCNNVKFGQGENNASAQVPAQNATQVKSEPTNVSITGTPLPGSKRLNMSPLGIGAANAFCWFGVPVILDKMFNAFSKEKISSKLSMAVGALCGLVMGTYSYLQAKKASKQV